MAASKTVASSGYFPVTSHYIYQQDPSKYGGRQKEFLYYSSQVIHEATGEIKAALKNQENLEELFFKLLHLFGSRRQALAYAHHTPNAGLFGMSRLAKDRSILVEYTPLKGPYDAYRKKILKNIVPRLRQMFDSTVNLREARWKEKSCMGRQASFEVEILNAENQEKWRILDRLEIYQAICKTVGVLPRAGAFRNEWLDELVENRGAMQELKGKSIELYKKIKFSYGLSAFISDLPNIKVTDYVFAKYCLDVAGVPNVALTYYITAFNRNTATDPFEDMLESAPVCLLHQDPFLLPQMLKESAKLFKEAVSVDPKDKKMLKERVCLWNIAFSHAMPCFRGAGTLSEWFESSMYEALGSQLLYNSEMNVNLEMQTSSPADALSRYPTMIQLTQLSRPTELGIA
jgi:hypothetical protein